LSFVFSDLAFSNVDLASTVHCSYQNGQMITEEESKNLSNPVPLNWTFNGLLSDNPTFMSGGDTGAVFVVAIESGLAIYLPSTGGTSTFTIWQTGKSIWGRQNNLIGTIYGQQFLGGCEN